MQLIIDTWTITVHIFETVLVFVVIRQAPSPAPFLPKVLASASIYSRDKNSRTDTSNVVLFRMAAFLCLHSRKLAGFILACACACASLAELGLPDY